MRYEFYVDVSNVGTVFSSSDLEETDSLGGIYIDRLKIETGGVVAVMGPSGSGKSTLLSLMSGLKAPNAVSAAPAGSRLHLFTGSADARDLLVGQLPRAGSLGFVFQESHLMKSLSVALNVDMARVVTRPRLGTERLATMMEGFGLPLQINTEAGLCDKRVSNLSGGQQQRVAVARAIASEPPLIFCDEPTSSLDPKTARLIMTHLRDWAIETGALVLWVTHDETLALEIASSMFYVSNGRLLTQQGAPVPLLPGESMAARSAKLAELKTRGSPLRLSRKGFEAAGTCLEPTPRERRRAATPLRAPGEKSSYALWSSLGFIWHFVLAELFPQRPIRGTLRRGPERLSWWAWRGPFLFTRPTFALVVMLGILFAYGMLLGLTVLDAKYARDLSRPEISHFVVERYGDKDSTEQDLLTELSIGEMQTHLENKLSLGEESALRPLEIFGRLLEYTARFAVTKDGCARARDRARNALMVIYEPREPLFRALTTTEAVTRGSGADAQVIPAGTRISDLEAKDLDYAAFVTRDFLERLGVAATEPAPASFCLGTERGLVEIAVAGVLEDIPGAGTDSGEIAMAKASYRKMLSRPVALEDGTKLDLRPISWGGKWPSFASAAIYFDPSYADDLSCMINFCKEKAALFDPVYGPGFKLDDDALKQMTDLLDFARNSKSLLQGVVIAMAFSVGISAWLSVQAFIVSHERFLAIMRAVGYRYGHIVALVTLELAVITLVSAAMAAGVLAGAHVLLAPELAVLWSLSPDWLTWSTERLGLAGLLAFALVLGVGLLVTSVWWIGHRHVGNKLQAV